MFPRCIVLVAALLGMGQAHPSCPEGADEAAFHCDCEELPVARPAPAAGKSRLLLSASPLLPSATQATPIPVSDFAPASVRMSGLTRPLFLLTRSLLI